MNRHSHSLKLEIQEHPKVMHLFDIITRGASSFSLASSVAQIQARVLRTKNLMFRIRAFSAGVLLAIALNAHATTILQSPNSQFIAWEGEDVYSITNNRSRRDRRKQLLYTK